MDDEHLSDARQNGENNDTADKNSGQNAAQNGTNEEPPTKTEHLIDAIEIVGGLVFGGIAIALSDAGFHILSLIFGFFAVVCGLAIAAHLLKKFGLKYVKSGFVSAVILVALVFGFLAFHKPPPEPTAHFKFMLTSSTAPNNTLELTNELLYRTWNSAFGKTNLSPVVVLPRDSAQSSVWLTLGVINDSSVAAEDVEIMIPLPKGWKCMAPPPWQRASTKNAELSLVSPGVLATNQMESWTFEFSSAVLAGDGAQLPPIQIDQIEETRSFIVMAKWKNAPVETLSFNLWVPPTNRIAIKKPVIAVATNNGAGLAVMDIPDEIILTNSNAQNVMPKPAE